MKQRIRTKTGSWKLSEESENEKGREIHHESDHDYVNDDDDPRTRDDGEYGRGRDRQYHDGDGCPIRR